jgi:hypothetical protein
MRVIVGQMLPSGACHYSADADFRHLFLLSCLHYFCDCVSLLAANGSIDCIVLFGTQMWIKSFASEDEVT